MGHGLIGMFHRNYCSLCFTLPSCCSQYGYTIVTENLCTIIMANPTIMMVMVDHESNENCPQYPIALVNHDGTDVRHVRGP